MKTIRLTVKNIARRENIFDAIVERVKPSRGIESMTYVQPEGLSGESRRFIARKREDSAHIFGDRETRGRGSLEKPSAVYPHGLSSACRRASFRKLGEQRPSPPLFEGRKGDGANVPTNGIDPSLRRRCVNAVSRWPSIRDVKKERIDLNYSPGCGRRDALIRPRNHFARLRETRSPPSLDDAFN